MILFLLAYLIYVIYRSVESMHMLQQNLYNENNRYLKWVYKNYKRTYCFYDLIPLAFCIALLFIENKNVIDFILTANVIIFMYTTYLEYSKNKLNQNKIPLKGTSRIKRLFITLLFIILIPVIIILTTKKDILIILLLILLTFMSLFIYYITYLASIIDEPINKLEYLYFLNKAKKKLKSYNNLKVIGITGSYGKTSSKNILSEILSSKYVTRPTPKNYNTPYGLMLTINNYLDKFDQILIAEMGAYTNGRIKKLCDFVHPKYGILTTIGEAHLETFKTRENIQKTKFELIESLPNDGIAILNRDDPYQVSYELKNKVKVIWIGIDNKDADIYATNIKCNNQGTSFNCIYKNENLLFQTRLLGNHNIYNILAAIALGFELGIDYNSMKINVSSLRPIPHRLELKKIGKIYQLDDAYNSNPVGARSALDILKQMKGTRVVVTPGMVELGSKELSANYEFGQYMCGCTDYVILVGKKRTKIIYEALIKEKFNVDNIFVINKVSDSFKIVDALKEENKNIYALYENDLPDIYTEGDK